MLRKFAEVVLKKLCEPFNFEDANPNFEQDRIILEMSILELSAYMKKFDFDYFYRREEILRKHTVAENPARKRYRLNSAGSNVYLYSHAKQAKSRTTPVLRNSFSQRCGCKARFTIQFSHGYEHTPNNKLNIHKQGDMRVKITWLWKHEFNDPEQYIKESSSTEARKLLGFAVLYHGVTWNQIKRLQTAILTKDHVGLCELLKITKRNVDYIVKESPSHSTKCIPIAAGFGVVALDGSHPSMELKDLGGKAASQTEESGIQFSFEILNENQKSYSDQCFCTSSN